MRLALTQPPEINPTDRMRWGVVLLAVDRTSSGHFSHVHRDAGFRAAAFHKALKTFHTHLSRGETETEYEWAQPQL